MSSQTFFFIFIPILAIILLAVNLIFATHNPYEEKDSVFECGFHSFLGQNRSEFSISFFIFALLFLLFDLEILLVYPYIVSAYTNEMFGLIVLLIFFLLLTLGFAFELGKNALSIDSRQSFNVHSEKKNIFYFFYAEENFRKKPKLIKRKIEKEKEKEEEKQSFVSLIISILKNILIPLEIFFMLLLVWQFGLFRLVVISVRSVTIYLRHDKVKSVRSVIIYIRGIIHSVVSIIYFIKDVSIYSFHYLIDNWHWFLFFSSHFFCIKASVYFLYYGTNCGRLELAIFTIYIIIITYTYTLTFLGLYIHYSLNYTFSSFIKHMRLNITIFWCTLSCFGLLPAIVNVLPNIRKNYPMMMLCYLFLCNLGLILPIYNILYILYASSYTIDIACHMFPSNDPLMADNSLLWQLRQWILIDNPNNSTDLKRVDPGFTTEWCDDVINEKNTRINDWHMRDIQSRRFEKVFGLPADFVIRQHTDGSRLVEDISSRPDIFEPVATPKYVVASEDNILKIIRDTWARQDKPWTTTYSHALDSVNLVPYFESKSDGQLINRYYKVPIPANHTYPGQSGHILAWLQANNFPTRVSGIKVPLAIHGQPSALHDNLQGQPVYHNPHTYDVGLLPHNEFIYPNSPTGSDSTQCSTPSLSIENSPKRPNSPSFNQELFKRLLNESIENHRNSTNHS